ncbi:hypothetical protein LSAT2_014262 [Lamellibrachia satsuma]|nr:hypothetical protein LSAT2_014262 [Lamellibrachia satsuma]
MLETVPVAGPSDQQDSERDTIVVLWGRGQGARSSTLLAIPVICTIADVMKERTCYNATETDMSLTSNVPRVVVTVMGVLLAVSVFRTTAKKCTLENVKHCVKVMVDSSGNDTGSPIVPTRTEEEMRKRCRECFDDEKLHEEGKSCQSTYNTNLKNIRYRAITSSGRIRLVCQYTEAYMDCVVKVVTSSCGKEAARWQKGLDMSSLKPLLSEIKCPSWTPRMPVCTVGHVMECNQHVAVELSYDPSGGQLLPANSLEQLKKLCRLYDDFGVCMNPIKSTCNDSAKDLYEGIDNRLGYTCKKENVDEYAKHASCFTKTEVKRNDYTMPQV